MAAPLSGIGQSQVPLSQPFQPGGTDQTREVRQREQQPRENELQSRGAASSRSQETNAENTNLLNGGDEKLFASLSSSSTNGNTNQTRGSIVNIVV